jgi:uncharacterized membrane protein
LGLDLPETYVTPKRHHAKKNLLCLGYLLIKKFFMSDMCLAGKNKKGEKSSNFILIFLIIINFFMFVRTGKHKKKQKNFFFNYFLIYLVAVIVIIVLQLCSLMCNTPFVTAYPVTSCDNP